MANSPSEVRVNCSRERRRQIKTLKAAEGFEDYDKTLAALLDEYGFDANI
jgi:hypothetical protein